MAKAADASGSVSGIEQEQGPAVRGPRVQPIVPCVNSTAGSFSARQPLHNRGYGRGCCL